MMIDVYVMFIRCFNEKKNHDKAIQCTFIGYADEYKGFKYYDPKTKRTKVSVNVSSMKTISMFLSFVLSLWNPVAFE